MEAIQVRMAKLFESLQSIGAQNQLMKAIVDSYIRTADEAETADTIDTIRQDNVFSQEDNDALFGTRCRPWIR